VKGVPGIWCRSSLKLSNNYTVKHMKKILLGILRMLPPDFQGRLRVVFYNLLMLLSRGVSYRPFRIARVGGQVWLLTQQQQQIYLAIPDRVGFYKMGIAKRLSALQSSFGVERFDIAATDYVIDIGANIGEFSLPILNKGAKVMLFEMDPNVMNALELNVGAYKNACIYKFGLWEETKQVPMFVNSSSADTSLIDDGGAGGSDVQCFKLDDVEGICSIPRIKLLKCDAEGAEPEVLRGAVSVLKKTQFISIDCGPERGPQNERTLDGVRKLLEHLGFVILQERYGSREILVAENSRFSTAKGA